MITLMHGDCRDRMREIASESIDVIFADPPYNTGNTKDKTVSYDHAESLAKQNWTNFHASWDAIDNYADWTCAWLREAERVLKPTGSVWICGSHHNIPDVALALWRCGWWTIQWVAWCIPNAFPHRAGLQMASSNQTIIWARKSKKTRHYYDLEEAKRRNDGKNLRDFWVINNDGRPGRLYKHPSKKPPALVEQAVAISCPVGGTVLDPVAGSGTTGEVCRKLQRDCIMIEQEAAYIPMIVERTGAVLQ